MTKRVNYRKLAFEYYDPVCAYCGFGIPEILEVAHINGNRKDNEIRNLVILCPTCHKMLDVDLISSKTIIEARDQKRTVDWSKRMKDAGVKAAATRKRRAKAKISPGKKAALTRKRRAAAKKAAATRRKNKRKKVT